MKKCNYGCQFIDKDTMKNMIIDNILEWAQKEDGFNTSKWNDEYWNFLRLSNNLLESLLKEVDNEALLNIYKDIFRQMYNSV